MVRNVAPLGHTSVVTKQHRSITLNNIPNEAQHKTDATQSDSVLMPVTNICLYLIFPMQNDIFLHIFFCPLKWFCGKLQEHIK